jgi:hypothetical protein
MSSTDTVKVVVRVRPYVYDYETQSGEEACVEVTGDNGTQVTVRNPVTGATTSFTPDQCLNLLDGERKPEHATKVLYY